MSPLLLHHDSLLNTPPTSEHEQMLMEALRKTQEQICLQKQIIIGQQAQAILNSAYIEDLRGQLQGREDKKALGKNRGHINTDGKAKILTQDVIFNAVVKANEDREALKDAAIRRKDAKTRYSDAISVWKVREMDRKEQNNALKAEWAKDVKKWEIERDSAKTEKGKPRWTKPKMPAMEKAAKKPKVADFEDDGEGNEATDNDEEELGSDETESERSDDDD